MRKDFQRYAAEYSRYVEAMIAWRGSAPIPSFREWLASPAQAQAGTWQAI
jgi:hypothetical protein